MKQLTLPFTLKKEKMMTIKFTREELELLEEGIYIVEARLRLNYKSISRGSNSVINLRNKMSKLVFRARDLKLKQK